MPWPQGCPVRPIHISQLYLPGVYNAIMRDVDRVRCACQMGERGQRAPRFEPTVYGPEMQPPWARQCAWDAADPTDVVPLQPSVTPPLQGASPAFFQRWGRLLRWENQDMIRMIGTGIEDGSDCTRATTISGHHSGLRENFEPAAASIEADTEAGFMSEGRQDLWIVPSIMVPKNCVKQRKWKLQDGRLTRIVKWRVTTDDSMSIQGEVSRNMGMDPEDWASPGLPSPRSLAEMVAIVRSSAKAMAIDAGDFELERIALWAFDLSHAYRELGIQRAEQGRQCFIWSDGVRKDMRCVFGAAHMVDLFENVSSFVMAVGRHRIREYERQHPFGAAREAWRRWRADVCDIDEGVGQSTIYLDDGQGLSVLAPGEPLQGSAGFAEQPLTCSVGVEPGGRVKLRTYVNMSRVQVDLAIMVATFQEAGWDIAVDKFQLGWEIESLGMLLSTVGDGVLTVPEAKRQGMLREIAAQQHPASEKGEVATEEVEGLVGLCIHIAMAVPEANAFMQSMYAVKEAKRTIARRRDGTRIRVTPRRMAVQGTGRVQVAYQESLAWWHQSLSDGIQTPLAPRLTFPDLDQPGSAFLFTDAAMEEGSGYGAFTLVETLDSTLHIIYTDPRWPSAILHGLQTNRLSMPAGEALGAVIFADALLRTLPGVTHLTIFTDSSPVQVAINSAASPSPQINCIVTWLFQRHPSVQFMAVHQPGVRNTAADGFSRTASATVLADAEAAGAHITALHQREHDIALMHMALAAPQRTPTHHNSQEA